MDVEDIQILGFSGIAVALLCTQALKRLGLPTRLAGAASVVVGLGVALTIQLMTVYPDIRPWVLAVINGLMIGAAASGTYSYTRPSDHGNQTVENVFVKEPGGRLAPELLKHREVGSVEDKTSLEQYKSSRHPLTDQSEPPTSVAKGGAIEGQTQP